jgi:hypothetical protein
MSTNQRQLYFTSPGLRSRVIDIASSIDDPETKHYEAIHVEVSNED